MEQRFFRKANSKSASQEIRLLWNPMHLHNFHNNLPLVPIRSQIHPVHIFSPCFPTIHSNITSHLHLGLHSGLFSSGSPTKTLYVFFIYPICSTCPASLFPGFIAAVTFGDACKLRVPHYAVFSILPPLPHSYVQIFSSAPCSKTPSMCSSLSVGDSKYTSCCFVCLTDLEECLLQIKFLLNSNHLKISHSCFPLVSLNSHHIEKCIK